MRIRAEIVTTARSDYGPLYWLIHDLLADSRYDGALVVGGSHLEAAWGRTVQEIEADGWPIAARIPFLGADERDGSFPRALGRCLAEFGGHFASSRPDILFLYGDRVELLPIATAAMLNAVPIAHLCGGDVTEGAIDDQVRHALTKLAHLHFPATRLSASRIVHMGEEPWRIHVTGDTALDHFGRGTFATAAELTRQLGFLPDRNTLLVTFHPATLLDRETNRHDAQQLAAALRRHGGPIVITAPAPDPGSAEIRSVLDDVCHTRPGTYFCDSLGSRNYRGLLRLVGAVVGNSSSGLIEAGCVPVAAVNVGIRQAGRERGPNVIDVPAESGAIESAIQTALSEQFAAAMAGVPSPYGDGHAAPRILDVVAACVRKPELKRKRFHPSLDIPAA